MSFRSQIIPVGVIDGVNTTFVCPSTIVQIDQIQINNLTYYGIVSIAGSAFTVANPPTDSIVIWYYDTPPAPPSPPLPGQYFNDDMTLDNLTNLVLRELKEPEVTGSEAVSVALVRDTLNFVYSEAFNDQRMKQTARENNISFLLANDTTLRTDLPAGSPILDIDDASSWRAQGRALLNSEMVDYTGNDFVNLLTGVTGMQTKQYSGAIVRQMYLLTDLAPDIEEESIQYIDINGLPQTFMEYPTNTTAISFFPNSYSIFKGFLLFSRQSTIGGTNQQQTSLLMYTQKVAPLLDGNDRPILIPNAWRNSILVYGACMKIAASDSFRTSWDWWKAEYERALSQYIAFKNTRVKDINNRRRPSLYNGGNGGYSGF